MADRFNFFSRARPAPPNARYEFDSDSNDDRQQLSPRIHQTSPSPPDIEAQHAPEMAERSRFMLPRWSRPTMPSFLSMGRTEPRPSSSHYSGDTERDLGLETPKTPGFPSLGTPNLPSTRLHLPNLQRTWTQGSNGPPSRPATARDDRGVFSGSVEGLTEPVPAVPAQHGQTTRGQGRRRAGGSDPADDGRRRRRHRRDDSDRSRGSSNRSGGGVDENEARRAQEGGEDGRRRNRHHRRHRSDRGSDRSRREARPHPKRFLFCFPWIKPRRIRSQILRCFVSGLFLTLLLTVCKFHLALFRLASRSKN